MPSRGLTLVELLVTILSLSLVVTLAIPAFGDVVERSRARAGLNRLSTSLQAVRSHAVTVGTETVLCPSEDGRSCAGHGRWEVGWLGFVDRDGDRSCAATAQGDYCTDNGEVIIVSAALDAGTLRGTGLPARRVRYTPLGDASGYLGSFHYCSADGYTRAGMTLIMTGRLRRTAEEEVVCP